MDKIASIHLKKESLIDLFNLIIPASLFYIFIVRDILACGNSSLAGCDSGLGAIIMDPSYSICIVIFIILVISSRVSDSKTKSWIALSGLVAGLLTYIIYRPFFGGSIVLGIPLNVYALLSGLASLSYVEYIMANAFSAFLLFRNSGLIRRIFGVKDVSISPLPVLFWGNLALVIVALSYLLYVWWSL